MPATIDALWAIQTSIYSLINADSELQGLCTGVFDHVPQDQAYPYIVIGDATEKNFDVLGSGSNAHASDTTVTIHIYSQNAGYKEGLAIKRRLYELLHRNQSSLNPSGFTVSMCFFDFGATLRESDGITRHIVNRYRIIVEEAS